MHKKMVKPLLMSALLLAVPAATAWAGLTNRESDGYLQWLHSLEQAVEGRQKSGQEEGNLLYPFDQTGWQSIETRPYRHLSIGKAIGELEREWPLRGEDRTASPLVALANARNYMNLSEFDSSLVWYDKTAELDTEGNFLREVQREKMATAVAQQDSLRVQECITNTIGQSAITGQESAFILALRWALVTRDKKTIDLLLQKIDQDGDNLPDRLRFWVAYAHAWRKDRATALANLQVLVRSGGLSRDLAESQRAWVLKAVPDFLFLAGEQQAARELYEVLAGSSLPALASWGGYQVANLDLLEGRYLRASVGFKRICEAQRHGSWQDHACAMADLAAKMERLKSEGEPYGVSARLPGTDQEAGIDRTPSAPAMGTR